MNHEEFAEWDAAYVFGALSTNDRAAYEEHLAQCPECAAAVRDLAGVPGLLAKVSPDEIGEPAPPLPIDLLARTRSAAHREVTGRKRWRVALIGAVAAAILLVGGGIWSQQRSATPGVRVAMSQVRTNPLTATLHLSDKAWGTQIDMTCTYPPSTQWSSKAVYALYVIDVSGHASSVSTWSAGPGTTSKLTAATAVPRADIAHLQVRAPDGAVLLSASPD
ncbi:anti-sigma factor family protein [Calidifontibacter terrae]